MGSEWKRKLLVPHDPEESLRYRIVRLNGEITDATAEVVIAQLLFLQYQDERQPITLYIDSPGGSLAAGMAVADTVRELRPLVHTRAPVMAHGVALIVLASGCRGGRTVGLAAELSLTSLENMAGLPADVGRVRHQVAGVIAELCGQPLEWIAMHLLVGRSLTAGEAVACGLADRAERWAVEAERVAAADPASWWDWVSCLGGPIRWGCPGG
ncbi:MAG: ATP-dependent Clp protease proteolytic subunit, partial [Bacteroidales bacterium]|nr:ATP-dependent Clp protease proteolytic subunit [Bacteroidales bacterium]